MEWLKMSPEYRVHTAVGNDGYEGRIPWMKTRQEISAERSKDEAADVETQNVQRKNPFEEVGEKHRTRYFAKGYLTNSLKIGGKCRNGYIV